MGYVPGSGRTKSRYRFNATAGSVLLTPSEYVLEARPGTLRLVKSTPGVLVLYLVLVIAAAFGFLGVSIAVVASPWYQTARLWENPLLVWAGIVLFVGGFFGLLFGTEVVSRRLVVWRAARGASDRDGIALRGIRPGKWIQKLLVQTGDGALLVVEAEASGRRFADALRLANVQLPPVPPTDEEIAELEAHRRLARAEAPGPSGPGFINWAGVAFVVLFGGFLVGAAVAAVGSGDLVVGLLGLAISLPLTAYMANAFRHTRRFRCGFCGRLTVFRRTPTSWVCAQCGGSWPA